jgi:hypothetical protein
MNLFFFRIENARLERAVENARGKVTWYGTFVRNDQRLTTTDRLSIGFYRLYYFNRRNKKHQQAESRKLHKDVTENNRMTVGSRGGEHAHAEVLKMFFHDVIDH